MTTPKLPSCRNLDIYRLVIHRGCKQLDVASSFGISPVRICQIVAHVHDWVAQSLPEWFWKGRPELRFQAALAYERIRILDSEVDPETVVLVGPGWTYKRANRKASVTTCQPPPSPNPTSEAAASPPVMEPYADMHTAPEFSPTTLNFMPPQFSAEIAPTPSHPTHSGDPQVLLLARRFAEILILWKKIQRHASTSHPPQLHSSNGLSQTN